MSGSGRETYGRERLGATGPEIRIGCSSWTSPAWNGRFYPPRLAAGDRLAYYARYFDCVEVDASYYAAPNPYAVRRWAATTPERFRFALKFPRDLLDPKAPVDREGLDRFVRTAGLLGSKQGPLLLQFPPWFRPGSSSEAPMRRFLHDLLAALPEGPRYSVELRAAGWFTGDVGERLRRTLHDRAIALCWSALTFVEVPPETTTDFAYLRFIADHVTVPAETHGTLRVDRRPETDRWAARLRGVELESAFAFFNNHFAGYAPASANLFREALGLPPIRARDPSAGTLESLGSGPTEGSPKP